MYFCDEMWVNPIEDGKTVFLESGTSLWSCGLRLMMMMMTSVL